jgi:hypothetical protein
MTSKQSFHTSIKCGCGCGLPAPVAPGSDARRGWKRGEPLTYRSGHQAKTRPRTPLPDRFWRRVIKAQPDECWLWTGTLHRGYGHFSVSRGVTKYAHRIAYELTIGPIPDGLELDHLCRNKVCVNPQHLEPVTKTENLQRQYATSKQGATK